MGDVSKAEKQNLPLLKHCWSLNTCLAVKSKVDSFSSIFFFFLSLGGGGRRKKEDLKWKNNPPKKRSSCGAACVNAAEESKDALTKQARNAGARALKHIRFMLFLPQTKNMFPFEMVESTAVLKSLGTSETNDPSQTVLTGSV